MQLEFDINDSINKIKKVIPVFILLSTSSIWPLVF